MRSCGGFLFLLEKVFLHLYHFVIIPNLFMTISECSAIMVHLTFMFLINGWSWTLVCWIKEPCHGLLDDIYSGALCLELIYDLNCTAPGFPLLSSANEPFPSAWDKFMACLSWCCIVHLWLYCSVGPYHWILHCPPWTIHILHFASSLKSCHHILY